MTEKTIGYNLKQIRASLGMSQEKFAEKMNVSRSCINHWENDVTMPNPYMIKKMKQVFGISYEEILDGI